MIRAKDSRGLSLLAFAAGSADKNTFDAVQQSLEKELTEVEVRHLYKPFDPSTTLSPGLQPLLY